MQGYRLYFMNRFSGHIDHRREFLAENDAQAIEIATQWRGDELCELWIGAHKLKRWDSAGSPAAIPEPVTPSVDG